MSAVQTDIRQKIDAANATALERMLAGDPVLVDVAPAGEVVADLEDRMILHAGPPIGWERMCGAQQGAAIGLTLFEGWASTPDDARHMLERGEIRLEPNHHHGGVGPMAGTTSRSLPVYVVRNDAYGNRAYCRPAEARQQFGDFSPDAIGGLRAWRDIFAPSIRAGVRQLGGVKLKPLMAKALQMGDELHNRATGVSAVFGLMLAPAMVEAGVPKERLVPTLRYLGNHELLFLSLSMAAAKSIADAARDIEFSTVVTAMARNGTEFGIRVSGTGDRWFTAPSPTAKGLFLPGFSERDAGRDMGDSAITETVGVGGFVLGGAPGILSLVGGTPEEALTYSRDMREITVGTSPTLRVPALGFAGAPVGIDVRKVVRTGILPVIDTAIAHCDAGHPIIGAGIVRPPLECFTQALVAFGERYRVE